jgi:ketosteroid isomerase-like protein
MTRNKVTIERYIEGFRKSDHPGILSCLTEDVIWDIPGFFHAEGKEAFDKQIENDAFEGHPTLTIHRMTEENDVVVAEGEVRSTLKGGIPFHALFCDVFEMREGKIKKLVSYLTQLKEDAA